MLPRQLTRHVQKALGVAPGSWGLTLGCSARPWSSTGSGSEVVDQMSEAASQNNLEGLLSIVEKAGESFDGETVAAALQQLENCTRDMPQEERQKLYGSKTFQMLADMAVSGAGHEPPEVLASTIGVLGRLGFADEMVFDSLARHLMPGVQQLNAEQIAELVEGLKNADHSPSVLLLDEVQERLSKMQQSLPQEQADTIQEGLRDLGRDDDNLPNSASGNQGQPDRIKYT